MGVSQGTDTGSANCWGEAPVRSCLVQSLPHTIPFYFQVLFKCRQCWLLGNWTFKVPEGTLLQDKSTQSIVKRRHCFFHKDTKKAPPSAPSVPVPGKGLLSEPGYGPPNPNWPPKAFQWASCSSTAKSSETPSGWWGGRETWRSSLVHRALLHSLPFSPVLSQYPGKINSSPCARESYYH